MESKLEQLLNKYCTHYLGPREHWIVERAQLEAILVELEGGGNGGNGHPRTLPSPTEYCENKPAR